MKDPQKRGRSPEQSGILCVSSARAEQLVKTLRGAGYEAWAAPSLDGPLPSIVPDLVLLETTVDYLADLAGSLWPKAVILRCKKEDSTSDLLRRVQSAL